MNRRILFMTAAIMPAAVWAQARDLTANADGTSADNWETVAAGGGRFFFCLVAGILLAYAFQWVLTSLSLATGATALKAATNGGRPGRKEGHEGRDLKESKEAEGSKDETWDATAKKVGSGIGAWALITAGLSTFAASWAAAELLRFGNRHEAILLGLTIWAGFMLSMMWLEATAFGSLMSGITSAVKGGLQAVGSPLKAAAGTVADKASLSAESIAAKVREEFRNQGGGQGLKDKLREYVSRMDAGGQDRFQIESEADRLFEDEEIRAAARQGSLQRVERNRFRDMLSSRGDISAEEASQWANVLYDRWERLRQDYQREAAPAPAAPDTLAPAAEPAVAEGAPGALPSERAEAISPFAMSSEGSFTGSGSASPSGSGARSAAVAPDFQTRLAGFKEFLRKADRRELNPVRLEQEVEILIVHPEEGFENMEKSARSMKREEVATLLRQRRDISSQEADSIADLIDSARTRMLSRSEIREHRKQESTDKVLSLLRDRIYSLKRPERDYEAIGSDFSRMLEDPQGAFSSLTSKFEGMDRETLIKMFYARKGISRQDAERMADQAEQAMNKARETAEKVQAETRRRLEQAREETARQAEATRQVAAHAAWWLFAIAVVSGAAGALGGWLGAAT